MVIPQTLIWNEKLSMFNEKLVAQHKTLFGYIIQIIQLEEIYPKSGQFAEILSMITDYGLEHFKTEERLMMDMHYPKAYFDLHQAEHKSYIFEVAMFNTNFMQPDHTEPREVSISLNHGGAIISCVPICTSACLSEKFYPLDFLL
jgi:hemerythrin-like metal-binding protein